MVNLSKNLSSEKNMLELLSELQKKLTLTADEQINWGRYQQALKKCREAQKVNKSCPSKRPYHRKRQSVAINAKKVICLTENKIFPSLSACAEYYGFSLPRLCNSIVRQGKMRNGLKFAYYK